MKRKVTPKALHNRVHTFRTALNLYYIGKSALKKWPESPKIKAHMAFTASLCKAWARSPAEQAKADSLKSHE